MSWLYLVCAIIFTSLAQSSYKVYAMSRRLIFLVVALSLFLLTPVMSYMALKGLSLSVVYMSTGMTYVLVALIARFFLHEKIAPRQVMSMVFIVAGVLVFNIQL